MSGENVEIVRRLFAELPWGGLSRVDEIDSLLSDAALADFYDPEIEWVPASQSLLAVEAYHGYEGVRRFWADLLSVWDEFSLEVRELFDAGDQVVVVMGMDGRMQDIEFDGVWSSLLSLRDGKVLHIQGFTSREGALEAARLGV